MDRKKYPLPWLIMCIALAASVGFLPAGCKDKVPHPQPSCSYVNGQKECPVIGPLPQGTK